MRKLQNRIKQIHAEAAKAKKNRDTQKMDELSAELDRIILALQNYINKHGI